MYVENGLHLYLSAYSRPFELSCKLKVLRKSSSSINRFVEHNNVFPYRFRQAKDVCRSISFSVRCMGLLLENRASVKGGIRYHIVLAYYHSAVIDVSEWCAFTNSWQDKTPSMKEIIPIYHSEATKYIDSFRFSVHVQLALRISYADRKYIN